MGRRPTKNCNRRNCWCMGNSTICALLTCKPLACICAISPIRHFQAPIHSQVRKHEKRLGSDDGRCSRWSIRQPLPSSLPLVFLSTMNSDQPRKEKPSGITSFWRYNASALLATGADFLTLVLLTELAHVWYVISTAAGALVGGIVAFSLGRNWAFESKEEKKRVQIFRYVLVAAGSLGLNTLGVYVFTDLINLQYLISKVITATTVAIAFNYPLSKYFIFK